MNIGFDLDGVLVDWHGSIYDYFVENKKFKGTFNEFWTDYWKQEEIQEAIIALLDVPFFYTNKVPTKRMMTLLWSLARNHEIFYITTRPDSVVAATEIYLDKWKFPFTENLFITKDKDVVARHVSLDLFIDDRESNLEPVSKVCMCVLRAKPWNKDYWDKYPTIHSLDEIWNFIKE